MLLWRTVATESSSWPSTSDVRTVFLPPATCNYWNDSVLVNHSRVQHHQISGKHQKRLLCSGYFAFVRITTGTGTEQVVGTQVEQ